MALSQLDKFSKHQKQGAFILTAVVVIPPVIKQELFDCSCSYTSCGKTRFVHSQVEK